MILGIGAVGVGALGARAFLSNEPGAGAAGAPSAGSEATAPRLRPTSAVAPTTAAEQTTTTALDPTTSTTTPVVSIVAACREAWGAAPVSGEMVEHTPVRLTLHHTAVSQTASTQGPARARQHQRFHQSLGWHDLAYHFLVDRSGLAYEGRDGRFRGDTGTEYDPTGHFLVCMEGDFDSQEPTAAQLDTTVALFAWASSRYGIDASTLAGHGAYAATSCPGSAVSAIIPDLVSAVADTGGVAIDLVCGSEGAQLVADLEAG